MSDFRFQPWPETIAITTLLEFCSWLFGKIIEVMNIEIKINKEVRNYQEAIFFGLSLRQLIFSALAVSVAVGAYLLLRNYFSDVGWLCILLAFPFAMGGFFQYNGMNFEQFVVSFIRSELLYPRHLKFKSENLYAKALENSSIKEALRLD